VKIPLRYVTGIFGRLGLGPFGWGQGRVEIWTDKKFLRYRFI